MAGGAVIAAAAAARRRRIAEVIEAFRNAGVTSPERARRLDDVVTGREREVGHLAEIGALVNLPDDARWYLDEDAYAAWQEARRRELPTRILNALVGAIVLAAVVVVLGLWFASRRS